MISSPKMCNDINTGFTFDLNITGGRPATYTVNNVPATPNYRTPFTPNGPYSFEVKDSSGCPSVFVTGIDSCLCTTYAGNMANTTPRDFCANQIAFTDHDGTQQLDANDTLLFVLTDRNDGVLGNIFGVNSTPGFAFNPGMEFGKTYYSVPVASDKTVSPGYNANDRCLSLGLAAPIVFNENSRLTVKILPNDSGYNCAGQIAKAQFSFAGNGSNGIHDIRFDRGDGTIINLSVPGPSPVTYDIPNIGLGVNKLRVLYYKDNSITTGCELIMDPDSVIEYIGRPRPTAGFNVSDDEICQRDVVTFTPSDVTAGNKYFWIFDDGGTSTERMPTHAYNTTVTSPFDPSLTTTNLFGCSTTSTGASIAVQERPRPILTRNPSTGPYCYGGSVTFADQTVYAPGDGVVIFYKNGVSFARLAQGSSVDIPFDRPGDYVIKMEFETSFGCLDSIVQPIRIEGPEGDPKFTSALPCVDTEYRFSIDNAKDVRSAEWVFSSPLTPRQTGLNTSVIFERANITTSPVDAILIMTSANGCVFSKPFSIPVYKSTAIATLDSIQICHGQSIDVSGTSSLPVAPDPNDIVSWRWTFGDGVPQSTLPSLTVQYPTPGTKRIILEVTGREGCKHSDTISDVIVAPLPEIVFLGDTNLCSGQSLFTFPVSNRTEPGDNLGTTFRFQSPYFDQTLSGTGTVTYRNSAISSTANTSFGITVTATTNNALQCTSTKTQTFYFYNLDDPGNILPTPNVRTFDRARGQEVDLSKEDDLILDLSNPAFSYSWTPQTGVSCPTCPEPILNTLETQTYVLTIQDVYGCFSYDFTANINILEVESIDVPDAFTPNGDGFNDVIYPDGLALLEVESFKVYNRWGDLVFDGKGSKLAAGWDGSKNGTMQQADTYSYSATIKTYKGNLLVKKGTFVLIR